MQPGAMHIDPRVIQGLRADHYRVEAGLIGNGVVYHVMSPLQRMPLDEIAVWARHAFSLARKASPDPSPCA
jgi:hypothetical protein